MMRRCTIEGRTYSIPDIWLAGICRANGWTTAQAIAYWHHQQILEEGQHDPHEAAERLGLSLN